MLKDFVVTREKCRKALFNSPLYLQLPQIEHVIFDGYLRVWWKNENVKDISK